MTKKKRPKLKTKKKKEIVYKSVDDVRCPICKGVVNKKWFNFRTNNVVEFIAECWSGKLSESQPSHIFYFQIEVPKGVLIYGKNSTAFE